MNFQVWYLSGNLVFKLIRFQFRQELEIGTCTYEPPPDKTNKMVCAPSEDSDQPGHPPSLIRVFVVRVTKVWVLSYPLSPQRWLIRLSWCPSWSESSLSFCWFCHETAHILIIAIPGNIVYYFRFSFFLFFSLELLYQLKTPFLSYYIELINCPILNMGFINRGSWKSDKETSAQAWVSLSDFQLPEVYKSHI